MKTGFWTVITFLFLGFWFPENPGKIVAVEKPTPVHQSSNPFAQTFKVKQNPIPVAPGIVVNPEIEVGSKIVIVCNYPTPEGGKLQVLWTIPPNLETEDTGTGKLYAWGKPGSYAISAVVIPLRTVTVQDQTFDVISGAIVNLNAKFKITGKLDPDEEEDGDEEDDVTDVPFPSKGFACIILKEASKEGELPEAQRSIFTSSKILKYSEKAVKVDNDPMFRIWDDDYSDDQLSSVGEHLRRAYADVRSQANGRLPWIAVTDGKKGFSGPLPTSIDETVKLLEKYSK